MKLGVPYQGTVYIGTYIIIDLSCLSDVKVDFCGCDYNVILSHQTNVDPPTSYKSCNYFNRSVAP